MDEIYLQAIENARRELDGLMKERAELDERIAKLTRTIEALAGLGDIPGISAEIKAKLMDLEISESIGLTSAMRQIIAAAIFPVTAKEIRDALVEEGFDPDKYSNMMTVIHNTLLRLEKQGEIQRATNLFGHRGWTRTVSAANTKPKKT